MEKYATRCCVLRILNDTSIERASGKVSTHEPIYCDFELLISKLNDYMENEFVSPMKPALIYGFYNVKRIRDFDSPWTGH